MTPAHQAQFRKLLEAERQQLLSSKSDAEDSAKPVTLDQASVGRVSRMDAMQGQSMALEAQRRREVKLKRIKAALVRLDNDEYGYCTDCDEEVAIKRLETDPSTPLCISCAERRESAQ